MTPARRETAAALLFLGCAALAGITLRDTGVAYRTFGLADGLLALILVHLLTARGAWTAPRGIAGWAATAYGVVATAQLLALLIPAPGLLEWVVVTGLVFAAWAGTAMGTARQLLVWLAGLAVLLALVKVSVVPVLWERAGPAAGTAFGLGDAAESVRRAVVDYQPERPVSQLVGFAAVCLWALATRLRTPSAGTSRSSPASPADMPVVNPS